MSRYTVVWDVDVESHFLEAWVAGDSHARSILTEVANWIDRELATEPEQKGRPAPESGVRVLAVPVSVSSARVSATFVVSPEDRQVRVVRIVFRE
jgi:hypothetical protein